MTPTCIDTDMPSLEAEEGDNDWLPPLEEVDDWLTDDSGDWVRSLDGVGLLDDVGSLDGIGSRDGVGYRWMVLDRYMALDIIGDDV